MSWPRPLRITGLIVAVIAVVGALFFLGVFLATGSLGLTGQTSEMTERSSTDAPTPADSRPASPSTAAVPGQASPAEFGVRGWEDLVVGDCVSPFVSAWEASFTTVDCAGPHSARLLARASYNDDPAAAYPGELAITEGLALTCTDPAVLTPELLASSPDLQWQASYPPTADQWAAGQRDYFCIVARPGGELLPAVG